MEKLLVCYSQGINELNFDELHYVGVTEHTCFTTDRAIKFYYWKYLVVEVEN